MSESGDVSLKYYWEKYCPCRLTRKNVVLITLTILCFALVTWTVVATIEDPNKKLEGNGTKPDFRANIDDSRPPWEMNFTMNINHRTKMAKQKAEKTLEAGTPKQDAQSYLFKGWYPDERMDEEVSADEQHMPRRRDDQPELGEGRVLQPGRCLVGRSC